ncbi:hypothetical protein ON010_g3885 [Phytophthora cinnamomi]|nr:hypothetical protein ON010_g3885 [Phytophthora cinnamomi]
MAPASSFFCLRGADRANPDCQGQGADDRSQGAEASTERLPVCAQAGQEVLHFEAVDGLYALLNGAGRSGSGRWKRTNVAKC